MVSLVAYSYWLAKGAPTGDANVTDLYTTDAEIACYDLLTLADDRGYLPRYEALLLYRADLAERLPGAVAAMRRGVGLVDAGLILEGAVPAGLLALAVQWGFERAERAVVPRGLRKR